MVSWRQESVTDLGSGYPWGSWRPLWPWRPLCAEVGSLVLRTGPCPPGPSPVELGCSRVKCPQHHIPLNWVGSHCTLLSWSPSPGGGEPLAPHEGHLVLCPSWRAQRPLPLESSLPHVRILPNTLAQDPAAGSLLSPEASILADAQGQPIAASPAVASCHTCLACLPSGFVVCCLPTLLSQVQLRPACWPIPPHPPSSCPSHRCTQPGLPGGFFSCAAQPRAGTGMCRPLWRAPCHPRPVPLSLPTGLCCSSFTVIHRSPFAQDLPARHTELSSQAGI